MSLLDKLWAEAKEPAVRREKKVTTERFTRSRDEWEEIAQQRYEPLIERISVEDQTLIAGLPSEAVLACVAGELYDDAVLHEVAAGIGGKDELAHLEDYVPRSPNPHYWELKA